MQQIKMTGEKKKNHQYKSRVDPTQKKTVFAAIALSRVAAVVACPPLVAAAAAAAAAACKVKVRGHRDRKQCGGSDV